VSHVLLGQEMTDGCLTAGGGGFWSVGVGDSGGASGGRGFRA
jgi:hypothetical protein